MTNKEKILWRALEIGVTRLAAGFGCGCPCNLRHIRCSGKKCVELMMENFILKAKEAK